MNREDGLSFSIYKAWPDYRSGLGNLTRLGPPLMCMKI